MEGFIALHGVLSDAMAEHPSDISGVSETHHYNGVLEVRFTQDPLEETIACLRTWADRMGYTIVLYEESTPEDSENVMVMAPDPDGELASWRDKLD